MTLPASITTNLFSDFKSALMGPFPEIVQVSQDVSTGPGTFGYTDVLEFAQSFQATESGLLTSVDCYMKNNGLPNDEVQLTLREHDSGADHFGAVLATAGLLPNTLITTQPSYKRFAFAIPAAVVSGTTYWLHMTRTGSLDDANNYAWYTSSANPYANGRLRYLNATPAWVDASPSADTRFKANIQQPGRYVLAVDKTNNKVRCYKSTDNTTWTEQDSANAPAITSTATLKSIDAQMFANFINVFIVTSSTRLDIFRYNTDTDAWGTSAFNTTAPTFNTSVAGVAPLAAQYRSPDYPANATVLSDYLFTYNGLTETVMGSARRRIKLARRLISGNTWTIYDIVGSANTPDTTLPGTGVDYDARGSVVDNLGVLTAFWTQSDDSSIHLRQFAPGNSFSAASVVGSPAAALSNTAAYPMSRPVSFFKTPNWWVAFAYVEGTTIKVARCQLGALSTPASWTMTTAVNGTFEQTNSNPAVLLPDYENGGKLFLIYTKSDGKLYFKHDQGADNWVDEQEIHPGTKTIGGISANMLAEAITMVYLDTSPTPDDLKFDAIDVFYVRADLSSGTFTAERDLKTNELRDYKIAIDVEEMSGTSYLAEAYIREDVTDSWQLSIGVGSESVETTSTMQVSNTFRYIKVVVTVTGGSTFESGVVGY